MEYRHLGNTDLECSVIGFGAFSIGGTDWQNTSDHDSKIALQTAYDQGINFFDTSNAYGWGKSEELIGSVFKDKRKNIIIATKGDVILDNKDFSEKRFSYSFLKKLFEDSLSRLQTDYIDLYQLHSPIAEDINDDDISRFFDDVISEGKVRNSGVSISDETSAHKALENGSYNSLQIYFNMLEQRLKKDLFPIARKTGIGLIGRVLLYSGFLSGRYTKETIFKTMDHRSKVSAQQTPSFQTLKKMTYILQQLKTGLFIFRDI